MRRLREVPVQVTRSDQPRSPYDELDELLVWADGTVDAAADAIGVTSSVVGCALGGVPGCPC